MPHMIEKMQGVISPTDQLLTKVADAITSVEVRNPNPGSWMDRQGKVAIKAATRDETVRTLTALGVYTVPVDSAMALAASGHKLPIADIDRALAKNNVEVRDRIRLKSAMDRFGLLGK